MKLIELFENNQWSNHTALQPYAKSAIRELTLVNEKIKESISEERRYPFGLARQRWVADYGFGLIKDARRVLQLVRRDDQLSGYLKELGNLKLSAYTANGLRKYESSVESKSQMFETMMNILIPVLVRMGTNKDIPPEIRSGYDQLGRDLARVYKEHERVVQELKDTLRLSRSENPDNDSQYREKIRQEKKEKSNLIGNQQAAAINAVDSIINNLPLSKQQRADLRRIVSRSDNKLATLAVELKKRNINI